MDLNCPSLKSVLKVLHHRQDSTLLVIMLNSSPSQNRFQRVFYKIDGSFHN